MMVMVLSLLSLYVALMSSLALSILIIALASNSQHGEIISQLLTEKKLQSTEGKVSFNPKYIQVFYCYNYVSSLLPFLESVFTINEPFPWK